MGSINLTGLIDSLKAMIAGRGIYFKSIFVLIMKVVVYYF